MADQLPPAVRRLAGRQGGHVRRDQLLALGMNESAVDRRLRSGFLIAVHPGVYAIGHVPSRPEDRAWGALLTCGFPSGLFGLCAAAAYRVQPHWPRRLSVITAGHHRRTGVDVHRAPWLRPGDLRIVHGIRVTNPQLTALHIASALDETRLRRAINGLRLEHGLTLTHVEHTLERFPRHPGARPLHHILRTSETNPTRSRKEDLWRPFALAHHLPPYEMNVAFPTRGRLYIVDVYVPDPGVIIELDGGLHDLQTRQDHARDIAILTEHHLSTLRIDPERMIKNPDAEAAILHDAITAIRADRRRSG